MKKLLVGLMFTALVVTGSLGIVEAKHGKGYDDRDRHEGPGYSAWAPGHQKKVRNDAGYVIHRTAEVIYAAQGAANRGHHYYGLSQAVAHQQKARELYLDGFYQDAIFHSLRARDIAFQVIDRNRVRPPHDYEYDEMEASYHRSAPRASELDLKIDSIKIGDKGAVRIHIGLDINQ